MKKRSAVVFAAAALAAAALLYLYLTPEGAGAGIPCFIHSLTGLYCCGCGGSRALRSVLHFDFYQALRYNAVFTVLFPLLGIYFAALGISYIRFGKDRVSSKVPKWLVWAFVAAAAVYGILRNFPGLSFLAPTML